MRSGSISTGVTNDQGGIAGISPRECRLFLIGKLSQEATLGHDSVVGAGGFIDKLRDHHG
jgi:hypothetical protein